MRSFDANGQTFRLDDVSDGEDGACAAQYSSDEAMVYLIGRNGILEGVLVLGDRGATSRGVLQDFNLRKP